MGLYLCVFDGDEEVDGVEVGRYADFNALRGYIVKELEGGVAGSRFPTLIMHSDSDGEWSCEDAAKLITELTEIVALMTMRPAVPFSAEWQSSLAQSLGLSPENALESFIDIDGELLLKRVLNLFHTSLRSQAPVLFQ